VPVFVFPVLLSTMIVVVSQLSSIIVRYMTTSSRWVPLYDSVSMITPVALVSVIVSIPVLLSDILVCEYGNERLLWEDILVSTGILYDFCEASERRYPHISTVWHPVLRISIYSQDVSSQRGLGRSEANSIPAYAQNGTITLTQRVIQNSIRDGIDRSLEYTRIYVKYIKYSYYK
jgi:hypothetical protein